MVNPSAPAVYPSIFAVSRVNNFTLENSVAQEITAVYSEESTLDNLRNHENEINDSYKLQGSLAFNELLGGNVNTPVLVLSCGIPEGVFKQTKDPQTTTEVLKTLESIKNSGFKNLPDIIKNNIGEYVTTFGDKSYSCMEYLKADKDSKHISFKEILRLTRNFHDVAINIHASKNLIQSQLDRFLQNAPHFNDLELQGFAPELFNTDLWQSIVSLSKYFSSTAFRDIYSALPQMLIHGDLHDGNIIFVDNEPYMIDFDLFHKGPRLWELTVCATAFPDEYLTLIKNGELFSFLENHYGHLEDIEKENFNSFFILRMFEGLAWMLDELKKGITQQNIEQINKFKSWATNQVNEIAESLECGVYEPTCDRLIRGSFRAVS